MAAAASDGLGELHVAHAGSEAGMRHRALAANGRNEVGLDAPAASQVLGNGQGLELGVSLAGASDLVLVEVVDERALAAEEGHFQTGVVPGHGAQPVEAD